MTNFLQLPPGETKIRLLPPAGMKWDYPTFRLVPKKTQIKHDAERWKSCPFCVREAVSGVVAFIEFVVRG